MPELYSDAQAAELYNALNPRGPSDDFYLRLAMDSASVLDVGCGTGTMLHRARDAGHTGRLVGLDPDPAALTVARRRGDVEWRDGRAEDLADRDEFELAVMMSHAFQCLVGDAELDRSLAAIRRALRPGGRFAFETRNPARRAWEGWAAAEPFPVTDPAGRELLISYGIISIAEDVVTLTETTAGADGTVLRVDRMPLRFIAPDRLDDALARAGFSVEQRFGGWHGEPFEPGRPELVTIARV